MEMFSRLSASFRLKISIEKSQQQKSYSYKSEPTPENAWFLQSRKSEMEPCLAESDLTKTAITQHSWGVWRWF